MKTIRSFRNLVRVHAAFVVLMNVAIQEVACVDAIAQAPEQASQFKVYADRLFLVKGDKTLGSGFLCEIQGKAVCMTNAHVVSGSRTLSFTKADGKTISVDAAHLHVAPDRDLAYFPVIGTQTSIKSDSGKTQINIGDDVVCFGNSEGGGVITEIKGKVTGIGPAEIEVDAAFVTGNSGSPIIHVKSGEVVGVATYLKTARKSWTNEGTVFSEVRRFCARLDGVAWKETNWKTFAAEAAFIQGYEEHAGQITNIVIDLVFDGVLNPNGYDKSSTTVRTSIRSLLQQITNPKLVESDRLKAQRTFINDMAFQMRKGAFDEIEVVRKRANSLVSGHHRKKLTELISLREEGAKYLKELYDAQTGAASAMQLPNTPFWRPKKAPVPVPTE